MFFNIYLKNNILFKSWTKRIAFLKKRVQITKSLKENKISFYIRGNNRNSYNTKPVIFEGGAVQKETTIYKINI